MAQYRCRTEEARGPKEGGMKLAFIEVETRD